MTPQGRSVCVPDLSGHHYGETLRIIHDTLQPKTYLEIGTLHGDTLALARCPSIAIDPCFDFTRPELMSRIMAKPRLHLFQMPSDDFFALHDVKALLHGPIDFAFLDGMHRCEFLLRDFANTERCCKPNSVIALHDCLPVEVLMTARTPSPEPASQSHRQGWWTGDVWRTALLLKRIRPDLNITALDAQSTGLLLITNLDPASSILTERYADHVKLMLSWHLEEIGIPELFAELKMEPAGAMTTGEQITARFWL